MTERSRRKSVRKPAPPGTFCTGCGAGLEPDWRYCPYCGRDSQRMAAGPPLVPPPINKTRRYIAFAVSGVGLIAMIVIFSIIGSNIDSVSLLDDAEYEEWCGSLQDYVGLVGSDLPPSVFERDFAGFRDTIEDPARREAFDDAGEILIDVVPVEDDDLYEAETDRQLYVHGTPADARDRAFEENLRNVQDFIDDRALYRCGFEPYD